jgi:hypothetical protein
MDEARVNNGLSIVVERKKVNCGSHSSQGPTLIFERKDVKLHLSRIFLHEGAGDGQNERRTLADE